MKHFRLALAVFELHTRRQLRAVDGGEERLLHHIGNVGIDEAEEEAQRPLVGRVQDALDGGVHRRVVVGVVAAVRIEPQLAVVVGIKQLAALLAAEGVIHRAGGIFLGAVEDLVGVGFQPAGDLPGQQVVARVHPDVVARAFQLAEERLLTGAQQIAHRAMPAGVRIEACQEAAARGDADRVLAVGAGEGHALLRGQRVKVRGDRGGIAHVMQAVPAHLVGVEDDDVRLLAHLGSLLYINPA